MQPEKLIEYNKIIKANILNENPKNYDEKLNNEVDEFLKNNKEFQLILERNERRKKKLRDGEVLENKEPNYLKLYLDDLSYIINLNQTQKRIFLAIFQLGFVNIKGHIELTKKRKLRIAKLLGNKDFSNLYKHFNALQKPISELENTPLLSKYSFDNSDDDDDEFERYYINPFIIGQGTWANVRNRRLRIVLDYQDDKKKVTIQNLEPDNNFQSVEEALSDPDFSKDVFPEDEEPDLTNMF